MKKLAFLGLLLAVSACTRVPVTNRRQVNLLPEFLLADMSYTNYREVIAKSKIQNSGNLESKVRIVGEKIAASVTQYLKDHKQEKRVKGFQWEFNVIQENIVNAWCMPGGKVAFYTGILPVCMDERGIAVVMGHEVAHAIARHGNERMSEGLAIQLGGIALAEALQKEPQKTQALFLQSYGIGSSLGTLAFSRKNESEADKMGLVFMAMAGYDPNYAVEFWKRMAAQGGQKPLEFLSTHPSDERRISDIQAFMPTALKYFKK